MRGIGNIVNFVRGIEPWWEMDLYTPVVEQIKCNKEFGIGNTFLLQYDAMVRQDFQDLFLRERDENMELGVWFENCRELIEGVGLVWRGREGYDWDWYADVGFLPGYTQQERQKIIDEVFRKFKELFGTYPQVAGSWLMDAWSMDYMCQTYGIKAFCVCREQYAVDAYTLWGGYFNGGYYPSKNNMLCPAQRAENQIPAPVFRMLMPDPIYSYEEKEYNGNTVWTLEPAWKGGQDPVSMDWYFHTYYQTPCLTHAHATTGQENSFGWDCFGPGYCMQIEKLARLQEQGSLSIQKLGDTGMWYRQQFTSSAATAQVALEDWRQEGRKSIWYNCKNYRANLFLEDGRLFFRDLTKFDDRYRERYLDEPCGGWIATYDNLPVVNYRLWSTEQTESILSLSKQVTELTASELSDTVLSVQAVFADGTQGQILFAPEGVTFRNCPDLLYCWGKPGEQTKLTFGNNKLQALHNGFAYEVPIDGQLALRPDGALLQPKNGQLVLKF